MLPLINHKEDSLVWPSPIFRKEFSDRLRAPQSGQPIVCIDPRYFRPTEVDTLLGDPSKAQKTLGWKQEISFQQMVKEMIEHDLKHGMREAIWEQKGFAIPDSFEANM